MKVLTPIESEFETVEAAEAHDRFVREKVRASLADVRPGVAHDVAMAEMDGIIAAAERARRG